MYKLVIADDEGKTTVVPLVRDEITIGRKDGNTIRLTERNVSRRHARLVKVEGNFVIDDLQSYNGVRVNGQRIGGETPLGAGDQVTIGDYQISLQLEAAEGAATEGAAPPISEGATAMLAAPGPPARLVMVTPPAPSAEFALGEGRMRIGRAEDLEIWVNHRSISREHAVIEREGEGFRLIDLESANGVRVNGKDVQNAMLEPGDTVELGQVRFRFVGAGEHYVFDADRTVQMDAIVPEGRGSKTPIFVAVAIVGLALVGAIAIGWLGSDDPETPVASNDPRAIAPVGETEAPAAGARDRYAEALEACREALERNQISQAMSHAQTALEARPGAEDARACQARAQAIQNEEDTFRRGVEAMRDGEIERAYIAFEQLAEASSFRERPEVVEVMSRYAGAQLHAARTAIERGDAEEGLRLALLVQNMSQISDEQRAEAQSLTRSAERAGAAETEPASPPVASARTPRRPRTGGGGGTTRPSSRAANEPTHTSAAAPERGNPLAEAQACAMQGNNECVIRTLRGRANSPTALALLIETYRRTGDGNAARTHMQQFVNRFPSDRRAQGYNQVLRAQR